MSEYTFDSADPYTIRDASGFGITKLDLIPTYVVCISGTDGKMLAGIKPDGSIEYGPNYTPDEAARTFWQSMGAGWLAFLAPIVEQEIARRAA